MAQEACSSHLDSIHFLSVSSFDSASNTYKSKYEAEQKKTKKLVDKLAGYRTVVQQVPKFQGTIADLKTKHKEKEKELANYKTLNAEQLQKILHLERQLQNIQGKQALTDLDVQHRPVSHHNSPSFEVIEKSSCLDVTERNLKHYNLLQTQEGGSPTKATVVRETEDPDLSTTQKSAQLQQAQTTFHTSLPQHSSKQQASTSTGGVTGPANSTSVLQRGYSAPLPNTDIGSVNSDLNIPVSFPTNKGGGFVTIIPYADSNKKPVQRQMEQEEYLNKPGMLEELHQNPPISASEVNEAPNWKNDASSSTMETRNQAQTSDAGARPKEWKPLNTANPQNRVSSELNLVKYSDPISTFLRNQISPEITESVSFEQEGQGKNSSQSGANLDQKKLDKDYKQIKDLLEIEQMATEIKESEDLMKFPSLNTTSPSPDSEQNRTLGAESIMYRQQNGIVAFPTDDQGQLTSQVESMVAILEKTKGDSSVGMSDKLYQFAETAKKMEAKLNEYQALIQRQHVQIHGQGEEITRLRDDVSILKEENETFLEFLGDLDEKKNYGVEPGWVSVFANQSITDPVRAHYPDSPMMKRIESLSNTNIKLFKANKDWHSKWELLQQQAQREKTDLESKVKSLEGIVKNLKEKIFNLEKEHQDSLITLKMANETAEKEKAQLKSMITALKIEMTDLLRSKKMLETELSNLKNSSHRGGQNRGHHTESDLLKQQLIIFAEDFDKERKDRLSAESRADKYKKDCEQIRHNYENKLKKNNAQLRALEEDLRAKARLNADLIYQVDDLKLKLQREQRKSTFSTPCSISNQHPPPSYPGPGLFRYRPISHQMRNTVAISGHQEYGFRDHASAGAFETSISPEHLPGAWKCQQCTYINYPQRSVCDICGFNNSNAESLPMGDQGSGRHELQSRGDMRWQSYKTGDVVVDTD